MPAKVTKPKAAKKAAPRRSAAPTTVAACEREMRKHEGAFRAYMAARRVTKATQPSSVEHKAALAEMESRRPAYTSYWRAYTKALSLGWRKRKAAA